MSGEDWLSYAACACARQHGDEVLDEPQVVPQYHPRHFAACWVDPHGFKIEVVSSRSSDSADPTDQPAGATCSGGVEVEIIH